MPKLKRKIGIRCHMMKKLRILGMELDNYTVWEAMGKVEGFLNTTIMNTVEAVSMEMLVKAQADGFLKECIEGLDLAIISDKEILKAAGEVSSLRMRETVENAFLKEFMRRVSRNHRIVYLLGDTREQLEELRVFLHENYNKVKIAGDYALADCMGDYDAVINEINIAAPDVILSVIATPGQEGFLKENKEKFNAKIWYGLGAGYAAKRGVSEVAGFARKMFHKGMMHSMLLRYKKNEE